MNVYQNVPLSGYSTMGLGGAASYLGEVSTRMEVLEALSWAQQKNLPVIMIGGGSNIVWKDQGFKGLVLVNKIKGYDTYDEDETNVYLTVGAGENWDSVVERSVAAGLTGIEALSLIPGTAGATPIQNVGAYGQEISQTLTTVEAFDTQVKDFVTLPNLDCGFSYRNSRFKSADRGRFFITSLTLHLTKGNPMPPFYGAVQTYFTENKITTYTPAALRQAVIAIRTAKLPDPAKIRNTGSFFANPIVSNTDYAELAASYPMVPHWNTDDGQVKLSAAWLIEQAGFKDKHDDTTGMATWPTQPLVLINEHAQSTASLLDFKNQIIEAVRAKFNITLQQEPELLPLE
jgi:UDP-N-acetylmuramate dehydrogenase